MRKKVEVIFLEEIPGTAKKLEIKEVTLGYFRNYLLPKKLAKRATKNDVEELKEMRERLEKEREEKIEKLNGYKAKLKELILKFTEKADEKGKLFGSVSEEAIKEELTKKEFPVVSVEIETPIKKTGKHKAEINLGEGIKGPVNIEVVSK
ncbi:MAG: 50S ribosomal protein L9 [Candidatus Paceibacterota bacterium]